MKRDMDLIRKMILEIERSPHGHAPNNLSIPGYSEEQIGYHAYLLVDSGLAEGINATRMESSGPTSLITRLTWEGHDFADACRNDTVWMKATTKVKDEVGSVTFDVMKQLLMCYVKDLLGLGQDS